MARPANTKYFALTPDDLDGASRAELYDSNPDFEQAKEMHTMCMIYATSYNNIMLKRIESEQPEFFEENNLDKDEFVAHLNNNMCLAFTKYKNKVFRDTTVKLKEKEHLSD